MGHSNRLRMSDVRWVLRLSHEVCELGDDARAWRDHMLKELQRLMGVQVAVHYLHDLPLDPGKLQFRAYMDAGTEPLWHEYIASADASIDPSTPAIVRLVGRTFTRSREQLCTNREWYGSDYFHDLRRPLRVDDTLVSQVVSAAVGGFSCIGLGRELGRAAFGRRDREAMHLFHTELVRLWDTPTSTGGSAAEHGLSPRLRQTLALLHLGRSEKQIAAELQISPHTVHDYTKALHKEFDVETNLELVARTHPLRQFRPRIDLV